LPLEGVEEDLERIDAVDRRDDEIERQKLPCRHGRRLRDAVETAPLVSVIVAAHDAERFLRVALESVLRQTVADLELVVVDDGSTDRTPEILARMDDARLVVLRNEERKGLAASLNRALDTARGHYVARLDADDVAMPDRLERQLAFMRTDPTVAIVGSAVLDIDDRGRAGRLHLMPSGAAAVRWAALFSSPFFHPSVVLVREVLERHSLRYDTEFLESEDYDLWTRLLAFVDGDNLPDPLVLYRVHPGQASRHRRGVQRDFQLRVALGQIARVAPELSPERAELAWRVGAGEELPEERVEGAATAFLELLEAFERRDGTATRETAARALARAARAAPPASSARLLGEALRLDPALAVHATKRRARRAAASPKSRREAEAWLDALRARNVWGTVPGTVPERGLSPASAASQPIRVTAVFPEPTPYRAPLFDRVAALPEIDLTVIYAAASVAQRTWRVEPQHRAIFLRGLPIPGAQRILHHDYPVTPGVTRALGRARPDVVVVSGWSTFAAQAAIAWCRLRHVPYVLVVESHDEGPRAGWRRAIKGTVVPRIVRGAAGALVTGTLARRSMVSRGASPERVHVFANTVDVEGFGEHADRLAARRPRLRKELGIGPEDVVVLSVARLAPEKGLDVLVHAVAEAEDPRLVLVLVGDGPERERLEELARVRGIRLVLTGDREWERIVEVYAAADVFALLSEREPWAVVVNEAAACGLPLVLSDRVGAAHDLLRDGVNGILVPAGDVDESARALLLLASDRDRRLAYGARSRELARDWGYGPSVAGFLAAVREAVEAVSDT
jgi:glycosyltransferase involved in cell wall biosynthesis